MALKKISCFSPRYRKHWGVGGVGDGVGARRWGGSFVFRYGVAMGGNKYKKKYIYIKVWNILLEGHRVPPSTLQDLE